MFTSWSSRMAWGLLLWLLAALPAAAQSIFPIGEPVLLGESCTRSPLVVEVEGQTVAIWTGETGIVARVGPSLAALGPTVVLHLPESYVPSLVALPLPGGFVVAWTSFLAENNAVMVIFRRFGPDLQPLGEAVAVESTEGYYQRPQLASFADGSFVLAWARELPNAAFAARAQRFAADGRALGEIVEVGTGVPAGTGVALASSGFSFALAWPGAGSEGRLRVVAGDGQLLGSELSLGPGLPRVVRLADTFLGLGVDGSQLNARKVGFTGTAAGPATPVLDFGSSPAEVVSGADARSIWVAWRSPDYRSIEASRLDAATLAAEPPSLLYGLDGPSGEYLIVSSLEPIPGSSFALSWQRGRSSIILPDPCDFGVSVHAALFGVGAPVVEVPTLSPASAGLLAALLALAGLGLLGRG